MKRKLRKIEIEAATADLLEARAAQRGLSVSEFLAEITLDESVLSPNLEALRAAGRGPWSPEIVAEDVRRLADFQRKGEGVPWDDVAAWIKSWGTGRELSIPTSRKL